MKQFSLEEYLKNPSRKVMTRDGRDVKILCTNYYLGNQCIIAEVVDIDRSFSFNQYGVQIGTNGNSPLDLFFASEKHEGWVNVYRIGGLGCRCIFDSEEKARQCADEGAIATVKIEWEE